MRHALFCSLLVIAPMALAQTPDHLVGITRTTPLLLHLDHWNCTPLMRCLVPGMPPVLPLPNAGGTAWDSARSAAWVSNGALIALIDDQCTVLCPPQPIPMPVVNPVITGLDLAEGMGQLWMTDGLNNVYRLRPTCPPTVLQVCPTGLPVAPNASLTGVAVDERNQIVFYTYSDFGTGQSRILAAPVAAPCQIFWSHPVPQCAAGLLGPLTGCAVDWCREVLYVTDGQNTQAIAYDYLLGPPTVVILNTNCCFLQPPLPDPLIGLAVRPGRATSHGQACSNGACANCPMRHSLANDPNLGNAAFRLELDGAPGNGLAWCILGAGPCAAVGPSLPPLCGPVLTPIVLGTLGPVPTGGPMPCGGAAGFPLPLPVAPGLCGSVISSQCIVLCPGGALVPLGTAMSNCLSFALQGS